MDSLFSFGYEQKKPLADRMRPEKLSDFVGQEKAVGVGSPLRRMIERDDREGLVEAMQRANTIRNILK